jgi:pyrroline-5-carboxylate reductase
MSRIALLGGGRMGAALVGGLLDAGWDANELSIAEIDGERRVALEHQFAKVRVVPSAAWAVADADVVIVAVKPNDVAATLEIALPALGSDTLILSIAAGVTIATLEALAPERPVVRAMPNTPAVVGVGASAIAGGSNARADHLELAERLLGAVGVVVRVGEPALDAVTGLSGSGPAYVFLVAEAMIEAGVLVGLTRDIASKLVVQTLLGSATLLARDGAGPEELRAAVTSPGGTTAAGLRELEAHGVRAAVLDAVSAAAARARELGQSSSST